MADLIRNAITRKFLKGIPACVVPVFSAKHFLNTWFDVKLPGLKMFLQSKLDKNELVRVKAKKVFSRVENGAAHQYCNKEVC
ncbi:hypothetical protein [Aliikangiella coralliicola]|uniref:Uncharacterized protein n=1 Tax=Aliikangiella coralliicola TaxID=2592383 RepID=A0A545UEA8_9GAMM|nr:hypothetical protein [Aliikangiella coralliicola]TQV87798.1 hypothetical protein FLL46_10460 [Aliikangiella coralliicola]